MVKYKNPNTYELIGAALSLIAFGQVARILTQKIQNKITADEGYTNRVSNVFREITGFFVEYETLLKSVAAIIAVIIIFGLYWAKKKHFYQGMIAIYLINAIGLFGMWRLLYL